MFMYRLILFIGQADHIYLLANNMYVTIFCVQANTIYVQADNIMY